MGADDGAFKEGRRFDFAVRRAEGWGCESEFGERARKFDRDVGADRARDRINRQRAAMERGLDFIGGKTGESGSDVHSHLLL